MRILLAALLASSFWYSAMTESEYFSKRTEARVFTHTISERADGTKLVVRFRIKEGEANVRLLDSAGKLRWSQHLRAGKHEIEEKYPNAAGKWAVRLELEGASGKYTIKLVDY